MELITFTTIYIYLMKKKKHFVKDEVWQTVYSKDGYNNIFYPMFFLQWHIDNSPIKRYSINTFLFKLGRFHGVSTNRVWQK